MVGCGALGCEYVKNFAMLGLCCGEGGVLHITDNDRIEVSNLSRQFLFREDNVGQNKSTAAAGRASKMNPTINIDARTDLVAPETEHVFNDEFWEGLDFVCNALDNMKARFYVDGKCVFYEKPLLESGTMGTGANVDVIVPHKTRSYADGGQADERGGIPMCTLRNFPHLIDHCIEWSRAKFEDLFASPAQQAQVFLDDPSAFIEKLRAETLGQHEGGERAGAIAKALPNLRMLISTLAQGCDSPTMADCVTMAFAAFHSLFRDNILDLISKFPEDAKTSSGDPFWSGHKKFPTAATYEATNNLHVEFMIAATNLFACMLGIHEEKHPSEMNKTFAAKWKAEFRGPKWLATELARVTVPEYVKGTVADLDSEEGGAGAEAAEAEAEEQMKALLEELTELAKAEKIVLFAADFEKDDDQNFHIDFIHATSNLRAGNYHIPAASRHKSKVRGATPHRQPPSLHASRC